jgi:hypothetical protein
VTKLELLAEHRRLRDRFRRYRESVDRALDKAGAVAGTNPALRIEWLAQQRPVTPHVYSPQVPVETPQGRWCWRDYFSGLF